MLKAGVHRLRVSDGNPRPSIFFGVPLGKIVTARSSAPRLSGRPTSGSERYELKRPSTGIAFDYENYAAWERLAAGKGTISDARFLVHEFAEIGDMKARNVDPNGPENFGGNGVARDAWRESFNKEYLVSHGKALYAESQFVASQIETIAKVSLTPEVTASVDPVREPDELGYMTMPDGSRLVANRDFPAWKARASEQVSIDSAAAKRLGVNSTKLTLADLVRAVKSAKMTP